MIRIAWRRVARADRIQIARVQRRQLQVSARRSTQLMPACRFICGSSLARAGCICSPEESGNAMFIQQNRKWPGLSGIRRTRRGMPGCGACGGGRQRRTLGQIVDCMANPSDPSCGNPLTAESPYSYGMTTAGVNNELDATQLHQSIESRPRFNIHRRFSREPTIPDNAKLVVLASPSRSTCGMRDQRPS